MERADQPASPRPRSAAACGGTATASGLCDGTTCTHGFPIRRSGTPALVSAPRDKHLGGERDKNGTVELLPKGRSLACASGLELPDAIEVDPRVWVSTNLK